MRVSEAGGYRGSIPACAGEPATADIWVQASRVYPRVCGGTKTWAGVSGSTTGLSPRVRGNRCLYSGGDPRTGSIPACAGEPGVRSPKLRRIRVYPRVCGGTCAPLRCDVPHQGLSPRVRGNLRAAPMRCPAPGSIPACAGEPRSHPTGVGGAGVYPRVCGGTMAASRLSRSSCGLSPRVRGNRGQQRSEGQPGRSIPACAGEPWPMMRHGKMTAVYPRVCGGTIRSSAYVSMNAGLSPRVRGNPTRRRRRRAAAAAPPPPVGLSPRVRGNRVVC